MKLTFLVMKYERTPRDIDFTRNLEDIAPTKDFYTPGVIIPHGVSWLAMSLESGCFVIEPYALPTEILRPLQVKKSPSGIYREEEVASLLKIYSLI